MHTYCNTSKILVHTSNVPQVSSELPAGIYVSKDSKVQSRGGRRGDSELS